MNQSPYKIKVTWIVKQVGNYRETNATTQDFWGKWAELEDHAEGVLQHGFFLKEEKGKRYIPAHRVWEVEIYGGDYANTKRE